LRLLEAVENLKRDDREMNKLVTQAQDALNRLGIVLARDGKQRVVDELNHTLGNDACLKKLKTMIGYEQ
jgi:hypothetical protein